MCTQLIIKLLKDKMKSFAAIALVAVGTEALLLPDQVPEGVKVSTDLSAISFLLKPGAVAKNQQDAVEAVEVEEDEMPSADFTSSWRKVAYDMEKETDEAEMEEDEPEMEEEEDEEPVVVTQKVSY